jgi:hypothetical protein
MKGATGYGRPRRVVGDDNQDPTGIGAAKQAPLERPS